MNFDFCVDTTKDAVQNDMLNSGSTDDIIVDAFSMNQDSPSNLHSKLLLRKNDEFKLKEKQDLQNK